MYKVFNTDGSCTSYLSDYSFCSSACLEIKAEDIIDSTALGLEN